MSSMRASSLLSVSKGKREPGSPERISPRTIKRLAWIAAIGLALLATVLLSASNGSGGDSGSGRLRLFLFNHELHNRDFSCYLPCCFPS
jgi:hypothetical protein